jgi:hypothetical protein
MDEAAALGHILYSFVEWMELLLGITFCTESNGETKSNFGRVDVNMGAVACAHAAIY